MKTVACFVGTRPEVIKVAPVYLELKKSNFLKPILINTGQHKELVDIALNDFSIKADFDLSVMTKNQTPADVISKVLIESKKIFDKNNFSAVLVQGDTATCFGIALAAYMKHIPVGHIEAGLRTYNLDQPWPEESLRQMTDRISNWYFTPTFYSRDNLRKEFLNKNIFVTGNTVIDAHKITEDKITTLKMLSKKIKINLNKDEFILLTIHRRENQGQGFKSISKAIKKLANKYKDIKIIFPIHPNPNVRQFFQKEFKKNKNIFLIEPLGYFDFLSLMKNSLLIISDSGGVQEEATIFRKNLIVTREITERPEALITGYVHLLGTNADMIFKQASKIIKNNKKQLKLNTSPFGDGKASRRIVRILEKSLVKKDLKLLLEFSFKKK